MALKIDQEAIVEQLGKHKDGIFLIVLLAVLLYGGWELYGMSSRSVEEIIRDNFEQQQRGGGPEEEETVGADVITQQLLSKQERSMYELNKNTFGSPEDQLRLRQEVQSAYEQAVDLYETGQYRQAIQMFDRVISLDVTETRINYPVLPSEYKRRAQREDARQNFDRILQSAQTDIAEGDRLMAQDKRSEALNVYQRAAKTVTEIIESDPDGEAIGAGNLSTLRELQQSIDQKIREIQQNLLQREYDMAIAEAQQALRGNDMIANLRARLTLIQVQNQIAQFDPNAQLISQTNRDRLNNLLEQVQEKLSTGFATIVGQADSQFESAISANDSQEAQEAIWALRQAVAFMGTEQNREARQQLLTKINDYASRRASLVIQEARDFYTRQNTVLTEGRYGEFDAAGKQQYLAELSALLEVGAASLTDEQKTEIAELRKQILSLRLPPPVTDAYDFVSVEASAGGSSYTIEFVDNTRRTSSTRRTAQKIRLRPGDEDRRTKIKLESVDTDAGTVLLSKLGYTSAEVPITQPSN